MTAVTEGHTVGTKKGRSSTSRGALREALLGCGGGLIISDGSRSRARKRFTKEEKKQKRMKVEQHGGWVIAQVL